MKTLTAVVFGHKGLIFCTTDQLHYGLHVHMFQCYTHAILKQLMHRNKIKELLFSVHFADLFIFFP